jgi:hypothetical protein
MSLTPCFATIDVAAVNGCALSALCLNIIFISGFANFLAREFPPIHLIIVPCCEELEAIADFIYKIEKVIGVSIIKMD